MNYREMYVNAVSELSDAYLTPAYAEAQENFFKVFETLANADCYWLIENERPCPKDIGGCIDQEMLDSIGRMVELLRRANYARVHEWEWNYRMLQAQRILAPA